MKKLILGLAIGVSLIACQDNESVRNEYTGSETVYSLQQGSAYNVNGTVTFKEKCDGSALVAVALGNISSPGADVAALLNPVLGSSGISETHLLRLSDETPINYKQLIDLNACIKIHLAASGPDRDIILAGGNIGLAAEDDLSSGRSGIGICKSE